MSSNKIFLAVVPARSGSKGIPDKNMQTIAGRTLISIAGDLLNHPTLSWIDYKIISTDSQSYALHAQDNGLLAPFLRDSQLASDTASAAETALHALYASEEYFQVLFDFILLIEPTSPYRRPSDLEACATLLTEGRAESALTVSQVDSKFHPNKLLDLSNNKIHFFKEEGASVTNRQNLSALYIRNGACYAVTRSFLINNMAFVTADSSAVITDRPLVNIDSPFELLLCNAMNDYFLSY
jgi:CMP-N,N'-diacetyllegionaminic acid synthase